MSTTGKVRKNLEKSGKTWESQEFYKSGKVRAKSGNLENVSGKLEIHVIAKFTHRNYRLP